MGVGDEPAPTICKGVIMSYSIGKRISNDLVKVEVNDFGDCIYLNPSDASFQTRYLNLLKWVNAKEKELRELAEQKDKEYGGRSIITKNEDGDPEIDFDQLADLVDIQVGFYRECEEQINGLFGQDTLKKYFKLAYDVNPNFVPDENCIADFLEEITPVLNEVYNTRFERVKGRYNRNRKGKNTKVVPIEEAPTVDDKAVQGEE